MKKRCLCIAVFVGMAVEVVAAERMVGIRPGDGMAMLVKQLTVRPGTEIQGVEFDNNDARSVYPELVLAEGVGTSFQEGRVLGRAQNVSGGADGKVRVTFNPPVVTSSGECFLGVRFPDGGRREGAGNGPGIGATDTENPMGSFLATGSNGELTPLLVDLSLRLVTEQAGKVSHSGSVSTFLHTRSVDQAQAVVEIRFGVEQGGPVQLRIFDVGGRIVRTLVDDRLQPGEHIRTWDGRNDQGSGTAAGVYLVQLLAGSTVVSRKVVFAR
jgi:hypothetical protein